jgi:hypothetical protein
VFVELNFQVLLPNSQTISVTISHYILRRVRREADKKLCHMRKLL